MSNDNNVNLNFNPHKFKNFSPFVIVLIFAALIFLSKTILIVDAGKRAIVFNSLSGMEERTLGEGIHFLIPGIQNPTTYNVRTQTYTMSAKSDEGHYRGDDAIECLTADGQKIKLDLSLVYNLIPDKVWELHKKIGPSFLEKIIRPNVRSIARNIIANYTVTELYSGDRTKLQNEILENVKTQLKKDDINVSETLIRNVIFSEEFSNAIEQKQVALQEAERMKYVLQKERREKERKIIEAEGEAVAISKKGKALRANPILVQYAYVEKLTPGIKTIVTNQASILSFPKDLLESK